MIKISKSEKDFLLSKGFKWHEDITTSYKRRHYYAVESREVLMLLRKYREDNVVERYLPSK